MLRASRRLLKRGGRLAFFTIFPTPGLSAQDYRRAVELGPRAVSTRGRDHREMLASAGFEGIEMYNLTVSFYQATLAFADMERAHEEELRAALGDELYDGRLEQLEGGRQALEAGLLRRALFLATRP